MENGKPLQVGGIGFINCKQQKGRKRISAQLLLVYMKFFNYRVYVNEKRNKYLLFHILYNQLQTSRSIF